MSRKQYFFFLLREKKFFFLNDVTVDYFIQLLEYEQHNVYKFAKIVSGQNCLAQSWLLQVMQHESSNARNATFVCYCFHTLLIPIIFCLVQLFRFEIIVVLYGASIQCFLKIVFLTAVKLIAFIHFSKHFLVS